MRGERVPGQNRPGHLERLLGVPRQRTSTRAPPSRIPLLTPSQAAVSAASRDGERCTHARLLPPGEGGGRACERARFCPPEPLLTTTPRIRPCGPGPPLLPYWPSSHSGLARSCYRRRGRPLPPTQLPSRLMGSLGRSAFEWQACNHPQCKPCLSAGSKAGEGDPLGERGGGRKKKLIARSREVKKRKESATTSPSQQRDGAANHWRRISAGAEEPSRQSCTAYAGRELFFSIAAGAAFASNSGKVPTTRERGRSSHLSVRRGKDLGKGCAGRRRKDKERKMDFYDPQTLSVMVFGGFMLVSAIGIFLVSTFSMKETSYEEALAKQRRELEKASQHKVEKKKKEKPAEKKGKAKKREEKPNGQIAEQEPGLEASDSPKEANPEPALVSEPVVQPPVVSLAPPPPEKEKLTPSPKEKKKKEKKVAKEEVAPSLAASTPPTTVSKDLISDMVPKERPVAAFPSVAAQHNAPLGNSVAVKKPEALGNQEEPKQDGMSKKKVVAKKKKESVTTDAESMLYVPYQTLCSIISSMTFGEGEAQQLIEILTEKAGGAQDPWLMATQKSDPLAVLKRQLEEKEKQLSMEQENASVAKAKLRELTKELAAEKAKTVAVENKWKEQLLTHEQEMASVQARMQASYQDHLTEMQQLQGKIRTLQEQLENGPNTQLARLQQENSILRDALNQATSQTESKQNAELAKLRQECSRLNKELTEKLEVLQKMEEQKKELEMKATACEEKICQLQISQKEKEAPLQKRLDEISEELHKSQASCQTLQKELEKTKEQQPSFAELQSKLQCSEMEIERKAEELNNLQMKWSEVTSQNVQLTERLKSTEALLEASRLREEEKSKAVQEPSQIDVSLLQLRLQESSLQVSTLEKEAAELKETIEQLKRKNNDLQEKNQEATEALRSTEKSYEGKLLSSAKAKEALEQQLGMIQEHTQKVLLSLFPQILLGDQETHDEWLQQFKEKALETLQEKGAKSDTDMTLSLREANESLNTLQAECDQYRTILAQTEGMLKDLQKSVEKEELVWEAKLAASEEALQKSQNQMKCLQEDVEKFKMEIQKTEKLKEYTSLLEAQLENHLATSDSEHQNYTKEVEHLREMLSESQDNLEATRKEALKQSQELAQAKDLVSNLQSELGKLRLAGSTSASANEDVLQLQKTLDKEKKLTKDLGCAATKLKELLKVTQEQLVKERETVAELREQLQERGENEDSAKEGTSV